MKQIIHKDNLPCSLLGLCKQESSKRKRSMMNFCYQCKKWSSINGTRFYLKVDPAQSSQLSYIRKVFQWIPSW